MTQYRQTVGWDLLCGIELILNHIPQCAHSISINHYFQIQILDTECWWETQVIEFKKEETVIYVTNFLTSLIENIHWTVYL